MRKARVPSASAISWGAVTAPAPGQSVSGDRHVVVAGDDWVLLAGVDGLGHGYEAAAAADRAVEILQRSAREELIPLARRCHEALAGTRGAVMALAKISLRDDTLAWLGIGNVQGVLFREDRAASRSREMLLQRGGVVGYTLPALSAHVVAISPGDLVVLATDGVRPDFVGAVVLDQDPQQLAHQLIRQFADGLDDALILVARYHGRG